MQRNETQIEIKVKMGTKQVIGWKGNVLEIMLEEVSEIALRAFHATTLGIKEEDIQVSKSGHLYTATILGKHREDPIILLT